MVIERQSDRCILRPDQVEPSTPDMEVIGTFNPGVVEHNGHVYMLVRVAERPRERREGHIGLPRWVPGEGPVIDRVPENEVESLDPRVVRYRQGLRLTFISHLRLYRSTDGLGVELEEELRFCPANDYETFGVEDPRITATGDRYWITYVAVSEHGPATALASTRHFQSFERHGIIFCPENKDVVLFPDKIGGDYVAIHRPNPRQHFSPPGMWLARSGDMTRWGDHRALGAGDSDWEAGRTGAGPPPLKTSRGWLFIYHGKTLSRRPGDVGTYSAGLMMMDTEEPSRVIAHSEEPFMVPERDFETRGFVPSVVFPTGAIRRDDRLLVYYGAADTSTGMVEYRMGDILSSLRWK